MLLFVLFLTILGICSGVPRACDNVVEFVKREQWGARPPKDDPVLIATPVDKSFVHHTEGGRCYTRQACIDIVYWIQGFHQEDRGWNDIGYSFLVGEDGRVYEGRGWGVEGAHTQGYNSRAHGISLIGTFTDEEPDAAAMYALESWLHCGMEQYWITNNYEIFGHRDGKNCTDCPGDALYARLTNHAHYHGTPLTSYGC